MTLIGKVVNLSKDKGYGFIMSGGKEYFFHRSGFDGHWEDLIMDYFCDKDIRVEFEEGSSDRGLRAEEVKRIDGVN